MIMTIIFIITFPMPDPPAPILWADRKLSAFAYSPMNLFNDLARHVLHWNVLNLLNDAFRNACRSNLLPCLNPTILLASTSLMAYDAM